MRLNDPSFVLRKAPSRRRRFSAASAGTKTRCAATGASSPVGGASASAWLALWFFLPSSSSPTNPSPPSMSPSAAQVLLLLEELIARIRAHLAFHFARFARGGQIATPIAVMRAGQSLEVGEAEQVLQQPKNDYLREFLSAVPELPAA